MIFFLLKNVECIHLGLTLVNLPEQNTTTTIDVHWDLRNLAVNVLMKMNAYKIHVKMVEDVKIIHHQNDITAHVHLDFPVVIVNWNYQHQHSLVHLLVLFLLWLFVQVHWYVSRETFSHLVKCKLTCMNVIFISSFIVKKKRFKILFIKYWRDLSCWQQIFAISLLKSKKYSIP